MERIRDKELAVDVQGTGEPLIFVHGLGGTTNVWGPQVNAFAGKFTTIRFDLEGAGRSPVSGPLSIENWVADIDALMRAKGIDAARFAAHSLGTLIVQHFAARFPNRVISLALLGVNRAPEEARRQTVRDRAAKVRSGGLEAIVDSVIQGGLSEHTRRSNPVVVAFVREMLLRQTPEGYARCCEAVAASVAADVTRITCPVLLVAGEQDTVSPPAVSEAMAKALRSASVTVLRNCGHWIPIEQPEEATRALIGFL